MREPATESTSAADQIRDLAEILRRPMNRKQRRALQAQVRKLAA